MPSEKRPERALGAVSYPPISKYTVICGVNFHFQYSFWHLLLIAFTYGYVNAYSLVKYGVFSTMVTGNCINMAAALAAGDYSRTWYLATIIVSQSLFGPLLSCVLLDVTNSRSRSYIWMSGLLCLTCFIVDILHSCTITDYCDNDALNLFELCLLGFTSGALMHWTSKLGYVPMFATGNLLRLSEACYRMCFNIGLGGPKLRGDMVILTFNFLVFVSSVAVHSLYIERSNLTLFVVTATFPLHVWFSGECPALFGKCLNRPPPDSVTRQLPEDIVGVELAEAAEHTLQRSDTFVYPLESNPNPESSPTRPDTFDHSEGGGSTLID